ncbi:MAG: hypothetical protein SNH79_01025 [Rikenellaceae bacterium]
MIRYILSILTSLVALSCDQVVGDVYESYTKAATFYVTPAAQEISSDGVCSLDAYIFGEGKLVNVLKGVAVGGDGRVIIDLTYDYSTEFFLVGNASSDMFSSAEEELEVGKTTVGEFCSAMVSNSVAGADSVSEPLFVGYEMATELAGGNVVQMERVFAFVDVEVEQYSDGGVEILAMEFVGVAKNIAPFDDTSIVAPDETVNQTVSFSTSITGSTQGVHYINQGYYQTAVSVVIDAVIDGVSTEVIRTLPNYISAKNRYVVRLLSNGAGGVTIAPFDEFDESFDVESTLPAYISIDEANSTIPDDVTLSGDKSIMYAPFHKDVEMSVALVCRDGGSATYTLSHVDSDDFEITSLGGNKFQIKVNKASLNAMTELWSLSVMESGVKVGAITLEREGHPVAFSGSYMDHLTDDENFDVNTFIDGELLEVGIRSGFSGYSFELVGDWVRFEPTALAAGRYVVQGGWKPNDEDARGEKQSASLWLLDEDGDRMIEYQMSRLNYSLPVVYINGLWWAKFPLRGDRTSYEDQIQSCDELAKVDLYTYMQTCTSDQLFEVIGGAYQSTHTNQLTLSKNSTNDGWYLTGMTGGPRINTVDAGALSPGGYRLPTMEETETHLPWYGDWATSPEISENYAAFGGFNNSNDSSSRYRFQAYRRTNMSHEGVPFHFGYMEVAKLVSSASYTEIVDDPIVWVGIGHATSAAESAFISTYHYYAILQDARMRHLNTALTKFYVWSSSGMADEVTYTHRCIKIPNDFILE